MPNFLNAIRKLPGLMDPERLMKTPSYAGDTPKTVASPAVSPIVAPPKPAPMPTIVSPSPAPSSLPMPNLSPVETPTAPHPGFDRMKGYYRQGNSPIDRAAINDLEQQYMVEHGQKRGWKDTLLNALSGAAQGMATTGDFGGAIGGALAGGAGTVISPKAGARLGFNLRERPELEGLYNQQQQDRQQRLGELLKQQQILNQQSQSQRNQAQAKAALRTKPLVVNGAVVNPETGEEVYAGRETFGRPVETEGGYVLPGNRGTNKPMLDAQNNPLRKPVDPLLELKKENIQSQITERGEKAKNERTVLPYRLNQMEASASRSRQLANKGTSNIKTMTDPQRQKFYADMDSDLRRFKSRVEGLGIIDSNSPENVKEMKALEESMKALKATYGDDVKIGIGNGGYPYAVLNVDEKYNLPISRVREIYRQHGASEEEIDTHLRKRGLIQ